MTEKGRQYRLAVMEKRQAKLEVITIKKYNETDDLLYSFQKSITVKEEVAQLKNMFRVLVEIYEEQE